MDFIGKRIIVGVSGSIAAYKAPLLVREIIRRGGEVRVVMTPSAAQFVSPLALQNLSKAPVAVEMFDPAAQAGGSWHIHLARECDAMIIAPASAATLARLAAGLADVALITVAISLPPGTPLLVAPAMDAEMWQHPAVQRNARQIVLDGAILIPPAEGELASGLSGVGRLPKIETLTEELWNALNATAEFTSKTGEISPKTVRRAAETPLNPLHETVERDRLNAEIALEELKRSRSAKPSAWQGKTVMITAGPTYEAIDDVRFIGNYSSGKMGFALAAAARDAGADVVLIAGPVNLPTPGGVRRIDVSSAEAMFAAAAEHFPAADCAVFAAAVADFAPDAPAKGKLKKEALGEEMTLRLVRTPDVLASLGARKRTGQVVVGFALESDDELVNGRKKLRTKHADMIVVNSANKPGSGFQGDDNTVTIISETTPDLQLPRMSKRDCAEAILAQAARLLAP